MRVLAAALGALALRALRRDPYFTDASPEECSCACCIVNYRADTQKVTTKVDGVEVTTKQQCTPKAVPVACATTCHVPVTDFIMQTRGDGAVDYSRFCFSECQPAGPRGGACEPLSTKTLNQVYPPMTDDGQEYAEGFKPKFPYTKVNPYTNEAARLSKTADRDPAPYGWTPPS